MHGHVNFFIRFADREDKPAFRPQLLSYVDHMLDSNKGNYLFSY